MKFPKTYILETSRCRLRFISKEDIPYIFSASRYKGFTDGMLWEPPEKEEELIELYESNVKAWEADRAYCFTIENSNTEEFLGRVSIRKEEENTWNLSFWTHPEHQGLGYMTEAVEEIVEFGFNKLDAFKIVACHAVWNVGSERVLKKTGMTFIRHIPEGYKKKGEWVEENLLGLSFDSWKKKKVEQVSGDNSGGCATSV